MTDRPLDLDAVRAFVCIADLRSFTRAAESLDTSQAVVSLRLKRLEERLGHRLFDRTPRHVALSAEGAAFLAPARALLDAHDRALSGRGAGRQRLALGISDHVAGPELPALLARLDAQHPAVQLEVRIGSSADLLQRFDRRELDAVLARLHQGRDDGVAIAEEPLRWCAASHFTHRPGSPLPLASVTDACGVRALANRLLDDAGIAWTEVFVGGGMGAVASAVTAGLAVAALAPRMLPLGAVDAGERLGLPALPRLPVVLHARRREGPSRELLAALSAAYRAAC